MTAQRAADAIAAIDSALGDRAGCHYCTSGLYAKVWPCPGCGSGDTQYLRDVSSGFDPAKAAALARYRAERRLVGTEGRSAPGSDIEYRTGRIVEIR